MDYSSLTHCSSFRHFSVKSCVSVSANAAIIINLKRAYGSKWEFITEILELR